MKREWKIFTLIFVVGFFTFIVYSLSPYYNLLGSMGIIIFFIFLEILALKKAIREEWVSGESAEELIKEGLSPSLEKERVRNITYLTIVTFFSLVAGLVVGLAVQQFISHNTFLPSATFIAMPVGIFVTSFLILFFVWLKIKKLEKD